jgi:hypothetical protein
LGVGFHRFGCEALASSVSKGKYLSFGSPDSCQPWKKAPQQLKLNTDLLPAGQCPE